ncbi:hypothetical protein CC80DRAFT_227210 [Byssothecium circinans]|uniref:Uncharacterized protein n=1 Tax=Byssothecium circinans TaxID=147558 RepID=A0A6A5TDG4_9PLEO|nr:hypothetical protein CC80DRAFT_227210 [Byssothecium circinans]
MLGNTEWSMPRFLYAVSFSLLQTMRTLGSVLALPVFLSPRAKLASKTSSLPSIRPFSRHILPSYMRACLPTPLKFIHSIVSSRALRAGRSNTRNERCGCRQLLPQSTWRLPTPRPTAGPQAGGRHPLTSSSASSSGALEQRLSNHRIITA